MMTLKTIIKRIFVSKKILSLNEEVEIIKGMEIPIPEFYSFAIEHDEKTYPRIKEVQIEKGVFELVIVNEKILNPLKEISCLYFALNYLYHCTLILNHSKFKKSPPKFFTIYPLVNFASLGDYSIEIKPKYSRECLNKSRVYINLSSIKKRRSSLSFYVEDYRHISRGRIVPIRGFMNRSEIINFFLNYISQDFNNLINELIYNKTNNDK